MTAPRLERTPAHGDAAEILHPLDDFASPALPRHTLVFNLGTPMKATERRTGRAGRLDSGGVMILPADRPRDWHLDRDGEVRHLHLYLDPALVDGVAVEAGLYPDRVELVEAFGARDPRLVYAGAALLGGLRMGGPGGRIYAEALATELAVHLLGLSPLPEGLLEVIGRDVEPVVEVEAVGRVPLHPRV